MTTQRNVASEGPWLTTQEVAARLNVEPHTLRSWCRKGTGPRRHRLNGKVLRFRIEDVEAWEAQREAMSGPVR